MISESDSITTPTPLDLCILIPCFNNLEGLAVSLQSIAYHEGKFLVLIVDDGSASPLSVEMVTRHIGTSLPIHVINLECNSGITKALNTGLLWIFENLSVKYIARLDCGDLSFKERFYEQVNFLELNQEVGLVGSWCVFQSPDATLSYTYTTPTEHSEIIREMYLRNVFIHPTVMFRSELIRLVGLYPTNYAHVEDYALFWEMLKHSRSYIIGKAMVQCEINASGISMKNRQAQLKGRLKVVENFGHPGLLKLQGVLKLKLLMWLPYKLLLSLKAKI